MRKNLKRYTLLPALKQLTKSLMFSRLDYCNNLFIDLPQYQIIRLLKLEKACVPENKFYHNITFFQRFIKIQRT